MLLACDKLIVKTAKRVPQFPMNWAARYSHKMRYVIAALSVLLFIGAYFLQQQTGIAYTLAKEDVIAEVFPKDNMLVMIYENQDEDKANDLAVRLEKDENVKSVMGYSTIPGKAYTSGELADALKDMGEDIVLDSSVIDMLYYNYYQEGKTSTMTAGEFLSFVSDTVKNDNAFSEYMDDGMKENVDMLNKLADADTLSTPITAEKLADIFDMNTADVNDLFLLYYIENGGVAAGSMTLPAFTDFVINEVSKDAAYGSMFDEATLSKLSQLTIFTDADKMTAPYTYKKIASLLDMDADTAKLLFIYYYALSDSYNPGTMTLPAFVSFLQNDIANDPTFSSYFSKDVMEQIQRLALYTDKSALQRQRTAGKLASVLGMDESMVRTIFILHNAQDVSGKTMTLPDFLALLKANSAEEQQVSLGQMEQIIGLAVSGMKLSASELAGITGIKEAQIAGIFANQEPAAEAMTLPAFLNIAASLSPENEQLSQLNQMVQCAASGTELDAGALAEAFGMDEGLVQTLFRLYYGRDISGKTMSLEETVDFILSDPAMGNYMDSSAISQLKVMQKMIKASVNGTEFTCGKLAELLDMDREMLKMLYTVHSSETEIKNWSLSMYTLVNFLVNNKDALSSVMEKDQINSLSTARAIINGSGWTLSVKGFVDFIIDDVLSDSSYADRIDADSSDMLLCAGTVTDAVISGKSYTATEMGSLLSGLSGDLEPSMIELMYLYAESLEHTDPTWTMTLETLFHYMTGNILNDSRFEAVIDPDMRQTLLDAEKALKEGKTQLVTDQYSRLIITTSYPEEGEDTTAFLTDLEEYGSSHFNGSYYLVGNSAMNHEMQKTFDGEFRFITLLTAMAIFLIVALTFKSLSIPAILVLLVQCGVYITVTVTGILSGSMYYLALLIVECILMGATIDYGILFTNYYREARRTLNVEKALKKAYAGSIHTIMTSGLILVTVTAVVGGMFEEATVCAIVKTLSIGSFCAIVLILFILPGILAVCDKIVIRKKK